MNVSYKDLNLNSIIDRCLGEELYIDGKAIKLLGQIMKISYTVYDNNDNIVLGGVCDFHDLADIQWQAFDNGHAVFTEKMDDE